MVVYGITMAYEVIRVRLGSPEMMDCREIAMSEAEAKRRATELQNPDSLPWPDNPDTRPA